MLLGHGEDQLGGPVVREEVAEVHFGQNDIAYGQAQACTIGIGELAVPNVALYVVKTTDLQKILSLEAEVVATLGNVVLKWLSFPILIKEAA